MAEFHNPYTVLREALALKQQQLAGEPIPDMLSPEEAQERSSKIARNRMYGELGVLSRDEAIGGVAKPLLQEAIKASQLKQTEHGEYDPTTGSFREFPIYRRQRQAEVLDKQLSHAQGQEAAAQAKWDADRQRAAELAERDRARAADAIALRKTIAALKPPSDAGTISYAGTDPKTGMPVLLHSKGGLFQVNQETGERVPHRGAVSQKDQGTTAGERKEIATAVDIHRGLGDAITKLEPLQKDSHTNWTTGIAAGMVSRSGPFGQALVQSARPQEFNEAWQQVKELSDGLRAGRFGMTLTPQEASSSIQYLPSETDDVKALIWKAKGLQGIIERRQQVTKEVLDRPGQPSRVPELKSAPKETPTYSDPEKQRRYEEFKRRKESGQP